MMQGTKDVRELAHRVSNGIDISLLWDAVEDSLMVIVTDVELGTALEVPAPRDNALDVFYHPFAYADDTA
jgi:hypothetical protein